MKPSCPKRTKHYQPVGSKQSSYSSQHRSKKPSYDDSTCHMTTFDPFPNTLLTKASSTKSNAPPFHPTPQNNYHYQNPKAFQQGVSYIKVSSSSTAHLQKGGNFQKPSGYQEQQQPPQSTSKKKRQVIKKDQINVTGNNNPIVSHKRNISANVPYQAITNHTLSNLNRPSPSMGSAKCSNYMNPVASTISARSIKVINSSKPQLLVTSQLASKVNQNKNGNSSSSSSSTYIKPIKSKLQTTLSLVQMLQSDNIQSARSAFVKPSVQTSQPSSTKNIKKNKMTKSQFYQIDCSSKKNPRSIKDSSNLIKSTYAYSTTNLRKGGVADNNICSTMEVPMPSKARQSVPDMTNGDQERQKVIANSNNLQLKKQQILKNTNQMRSRTNINSQSTAASNSSYDQRPETIGIGNYALQNEKQQSGPLIPLNANIRLNSQKKEAIKVDQDDFQLQCGQDIKNIEEQDSDQEDEKQILN